MWSLTPISLTPRAASPIAAWEPTLPKPWTIAVAPGRRDVERVERAKGEEGDAVAGRLAPAERAAGADRLAGDDLRHGHALIHRIGVHEPGHHLLVGAHVGRHHVGARADEGDHLLHVAAGEVLELLGLERARIDRDAALAAAEGQIGERAFPAHPDRERGDFADVDIGREARAALGGTERQMMLDPIADEELASGCPPCGPDR